MNAPKKIWVDDCLIAYDSEVDPIDDSDPITQYIRADIVEELLKRTECYLRNTGDPASRDLWEDICVYLHGENTNARTEEDLG